MSLAATTLSAAIGTTDTAISLASLTNITAPNYQTGAGITYLFVEQELMKVVSLIGTTGANVVRGELGSLASTHGASCPVVSGLPADFPGFTAAQKTNVPPYPLQAQGFSAPLVGANTNVAPGPFFHLTGTTIMKTLTAPAGFVEGGEINIVFDGSGAGLTWDATGNIAVAGTATTAGSLVSFVFDQGSAKWHPSRLA